MRRALLLTLLLLALLLPAARADDGWGSLEQYATPLPFGADAYAQAYEALCGQAGGATLEWRADEPLEGGFLARTAFAGEMTDAALLLDEDGRLCAVKTYLSLSLEDEDEAREGLTRLYNTAGTMALACGVAAGGQPALEDVRTVTDALGRVLDFSQEAYEELIRGRGLTVEVSGFQATLFAKLYFVEGHYVDVFAAIAPAALKF